MANLLINTTVGGNTVITTSNIGSYALTSIPTFDSLTSKSGGTGTYQTSGDFRAPIFYDSADTTYYLDPNGTSVVNAINMAGQLNMFGGSYFGTIRFGTVSYWSCGISQRDAANAEMRIWAKGGSSGSIYFATGHDGESASANLPTDGMALKNNNLGIGGFTNNEFPVSKLHVKGRITVQNGNDSGTLYGPNATWGAYLYVGAASNNVASTTAQVISTDGNLHIDSGSGSKQIYMNYYSGMVTGIYGGLNMQNTYITNASYIRSNTNIYTDQNYGYGLVGIYNSTRYQGVFAMGDAYKLPADGTSTGNLYGLAWSHPNAGGVASNLNDHGLLVINNGVFAAAISSSIRAAADMRAPIFYDSQNTAYYVDPNGTSHVVNIEAVGFVGLNGNQTRDKLRVWDSGTYTIGMKNGYDYGHLGTDEYAMSFQMNNNSGRGFWWGDEAHNDNQGAASLTTDGRMVIAKSLSIGEGEAVVSPSSVPLYVAGTTSGSDVLAVDGVNGRLFTVTDDLSDSLFSVNTIAGLPVIEAFADNTVKIGKYGSNSITISGSKIAINSDSVDSNFPFFVGDRSIAGSRYSLTNKGMGFNLADNYAQLQLYGGNGSYIDFVTASGQDSAGRIMWDGNFNIQGTTYFANNIYTYTLYDRNDTAYYLDMNGTSRLGTLNINQLSVYGNTYLGDGNGDETHINDILRVGATDSGDAHFYFGEGSQAGSDYGSHWYWDSGYRFTWNTRNNGTDTVLFYYDTNSLSYITWNRSHNINANSIDYVGQLHFNGGTRFLSYNTNYLYFQTDSTNNGGIIVRDGNASTRGHLGYFDANGFGLLNSSGNWGIRLNPGNVGAELFYAGDWRIRTRSDGAGVNGNLYTDVNYGYGVVGLYSAERYQGVFAMGDSYKLSADGTSSGSLYGIAWTHTNIGGQSKSGLGHQALFMANGSTQTAIGYGIWTVGLITTTSYGTSANWNTAYGWGNHASAGYITSSGNISGYAMSLNGYGNQTEHTILTGPANGPVIKVRYDSSTANRYIDIGYKDGYGVYSEGLKIYNNSTLTFTGYTIYHAGNIPTWNQNTTGTASNITAYTINQNLGTASDPTFNSIYFANGNLRLYQGDGTALRIVTAYGYINIGAQNGSWSHIYSDKAFYFNQNLYINGNIVITSATIGSQSVSYATTAGSSVNFMSTSHAGSYWLVNNWTGTHWQITSNHGAGVRVAYADSVANFSGTSSGTNTGDQTNISGNAATATYATTAGSAPNGSNINQFYNVTAGVGNGLRFWGDGDYYKISMGVGSLYQYGPVTDYSIKTQMDAGSTGRGFTWGNNGVTPIAALNATSGDMEVAGYYKSYGYRGNGNVGGTGSASWHPDGIYCGSTMWQYGSLNKSNTGIYNVSEMTMYSGPILTTYNTRNLIVRALDNNADVGILGQKSGGGFAFQIYGTGSSYGFLNGTWAAWDIRKAVSGAMYMNDNDSYYLQTNSTSNFYALNIQGNAVVHAGNIGSQSVSYASSAGSANGVSGLTLTSSANGINPDSVTQNQIGYNTSVSLFGQSDGGLYSSAYSSSWIHQIYGDFRTGQIAIRGKNNGTWQAWRVVLDSSNYTSYAPSLTGSGASGTWGISISGNAATATNVAYSGLTGTVPTWNQNTTGNSATVGGYAVSGSVGANTVVIRDANNYIYAHYINSNVSETENPTINSFYTSNGDGWLRKSSVAHVKSQLGLGSMAYEASGTYQTVSGAINTGNIASQSVSYATISQQLTKFGDIYGQDWNSYFITGKLIVSNALGHSGSNRPSDSYGYGTTLSYGETGGPLMQMYFPEDVGNTGGAYRALAYRSGYNGGWSPWKTVVNQVGNTCTVAGSNGTGLQVHSNVGYNQNPLTYFLLRGQADSSWKTFKILLTGDAGGQDIEFRRIAENSTDARIFYVPRGANQVIFDYTVVTPSDSRLKDNLTPISTPVDKIKSLRGVEFDWNSGEHVGTHDVGLIAQDVEAVLPEAVTTQEDGYKNLAYTKVIPLLVEAMKEQQATIDNLLARIKTLENN